MVAMVLGFLALFYAGAVVMTGFAWLSAWRGIVGYRALRDLTGIADRAVLRRFFGPALANGSYRVSVSAILRHRRRVGLIMTDAPVHPFFLLSLLLCFADLAAPATLAVACVAALHAAVVAAAALVVIIGQRQVILP